MLNTTLKPYHDIMITKISDNLFIIISRYVTNILPNPNYKCSITYHQQLSCWWGLTLIEPGSCASSSGWWERTVDFFIVQIRVVVHQVKVDAGLHNTFRLLPHWRAVVVALETGRWVAAFVPFVVTRMTPAERGPPPLGGAFDKRGVLTWLRQDFSA